MSDVDLQVDHIDPTTKRWTPASIWSRNAFEREQELAKCQVLCKVCHDWKSRNEKAFACSKCVKSHRRCYHK